MWPSSTSNQSYPNHASVAIARAFFCTWKNYANSRGICYHWHEATDGSWRTVTGDLEFEKHLGLYDDSLKYKYGSWC